MMLTPMQYDMLTGRINASSRGSVEKIAGLWDIPVQGKDSKHKWGLCYSNCYGVPYVFPSFPLTRGQRRAVKKAMRDIERATCIR